MITKNSLLALFMATAVMASCSSDAKRVMDPQEGPKKPITEPPINPDTPINPETAMVYLARHFKITLETLGHSLN